MTLKEEFLAISSYEEFDSKREAFRTLIIDNDVLEHLNHIFPRPTLLKGDAIFPKQRHEEVDTNG